MQDDMNIKVFVMVSVLRLVFCHEEDKSHTVNGVWYIWVNQIRRFGSVNKSQWNRKEMVLIYF